ncbi:hypothetical protein BS47DRAFT_1339957 [Hydnum rufescens UP504]|uniref:Uncharacterized protein n=1 Tax=Hydnum rufescens UP504 TaxID=1448309 RepID=A0A9P6B4G3_9AGAM|nr:hypothetical protein BS47DRAFT_1339957 [Hydnum rufescens UP504]
MYNIWNSLSFVTHLDHANGVRADRTISSEAQRLSKKGKHEVQEKVDKDVHNCLCSSHPPLVHTLSSDFHTSDFEIMRLVVSVRPLPSSSRSSNSPQGDDAMVRNNFAHMQSWGANTVASTSSPLPPWSSPPAPSPPSNAPEDDDDFGPESNDELLDYLFSLFDPMTKVEVLTQFENWGAPWHASLSSMTLH